MVSILDVIFILVLAYVGYLMYNLKQDIGIINDYFAYLESNINYDRDKQNIFNQDVKNILDLHRLNIDCLMYDYYVHINHYYHLDQDKIPYKIDGSLEREFELSKWREEIETKAKAMNISLGPYVRSK